MMWLSETHSIPDCRLNRNDGALGWSRSSYDRSWWRDWSLSCSGTCQKKRSQSCWAGTQGGEDSDKFPVKPREFWCRNTPGWGPKTRLFFRINYERVVPRNNVLWYLITKETHPLTLRHIHVLHTPYAYHVTLTWIKALPPTGRIFWARAVSSCLKEPTSKPSTIISWNLV